MSVDFLRKQRGLELKSLRKAKGITQTNISKLSGISLPTVIRMERAKVNWSIDSELKFRHVLSGLPDKQKSKKERV